MIPKYDVLEYVSPAKLAKVEKEAPGRKLRIVGIYKQEDFESSAQMPNWFAESPEGMLVILYKRETQIIPPNFANILDLKRPIVFFDLETTGLNVEEDRIIEIALYYIDPLAWKKEPGTDHFSEESGNLYQAYSTFVNPGFEISAEVTEVTGITNDDLKDAPVFNDLATILKPFFEDSDIGGHNVRAYDIPLLRNEYKRSALHCPIPKDVVVMDTLEIARRQVRHTLEHMFDFYIKGHRDPDIRKNHYFDPHRAMSDTMASVAIFFQQLNYEFVGGDLESLDEYFMHPYLDHNRCLKYGEDGKIYIAFGKKWRDTRLIEVMKRDMDYINWMIDEIGGEVAEILEEKQQVYLSHFG